MARAVIGQSIKGSNGVLRVSSTKDDFVWLSLLEKQLLDGFKALELSQLAGKSRFNACTDGSLHLQGLKMRQWRRLFLRWQPLKDAIVGYQDSLRKGQIVMLFWTLS